MREDRLLQRFSAKGSEAAFAELVRRHLNFVYSICRRKVGDAELAQDITQSVFLLLATKANTFKSGTVLSGWLFQTAHHACQNALRVESRRQNYERKAIQEMEHTAGFGNDWATVESWPQVEPILDDALAQLSAADRDVVLLRYVDELSPDEMAVALGISAAAAQKRVSRALERLRRGLEQAGTALTVAAIGVILTEKMVQAVPPAAANSILLAVCQPSLSVAGGGAWLGASQLARWGRPAALSKGQGVTVALLFGAVIAVGIGAIAFVTAKSHTHLPVAAAGNRIGNAIDSAPEKRITVQGTVINVDGSPAFGAAVTILRYAAPNGTQSKFAEVQTDRLGRYSASGLSSGQDQWEIVADSGNRLGWGAPGVSCVLLPPTRVRLHLVGTDRHPLPDVEMQPLLLTRAGAAAQPETINLAPICPKRLIVRSNGAGIAAFEGLPQGCVVSFAVLDLAYQRRPPSADGLPLAGSGDSGEYTVAVAPGASVSGRLFYDTTGLPASDVRVGAQETTSSAWGEAQTDANGRYQINQLPPGRYNIAVDEDSPFLGTDWTAPAIPGVVLSSGQHVAGQEMRLIPGALITGKITRRGSQVPIVATEIGAYGPAHPATGAWVGGGWTQADGTYQIRVPPGNQHVYPMAFPAEGGADITVHAGQNAIVNFAVP